MDLEGGAKESAPRRRGVLCVIAALVLAAGFLGARGISPMSEARRRLGPKYTGYKAHACE